MNIAIVTNINGIGLSRDYELLSTFLILEGHTVQPVQFDEPINPVIMELNFDLAIFLEVVPRDKLNICDRRWLIANHEWIKRDMIDIVNKCFEKVFAKTREGERVLTKLFPGKVHFVGFMAQDRYIPEIERRPWFIHIGGNSSLRGTQAVVDAWRWIKDGKRIDAHLHVISRALKDRPPLPLVHYYDIMEDDEHLQSLQNQCAFHLYPSGTEGFGHAIHEGMSTDNTLIVTGEPPLDEIEQSVHLQSCGKTTYNFATVYEVSALDIFRTCQDLLTLWRNHNMQHVVRPRKEFLAERNKFKDRFREHLKQEPIEVEAPAIIKGNRIHKIAFLGNFENEDSTENMVKWALEDLDIPVFPIQENHIASMKTLEQYTRDADGFLWIHTHGWFKHADEHMLDFLAAIEKRGVRTISMHLDKYWGIPEREKRIGVHPFWKTQFVYTADGGFQKEFGERGVRHFWLRPAVSKVYCHPGIPREEFTCDVGFVGARDYHTEYPFRKELVDFLEAEYSGRFMHVQGVRGHRLNDFYASCKVAVGDCIFAGTPYYWSDRVAETTGRFGFLLHPKVKGLEVPCAMYDAQNLESLKFAIESWLSADADYRRQVLNIASFHTCKYDTWTERMREILLKVYE